MEIIRHEIDNIADLSVYQLVVKVTGRYRSLTAFVCCKDFQQCGATLSAIYEHISLTATVGCLRSPQNVLANNSWRGGFP